MANKGLSSLLNFYHGGMDGDDAPIKILPDDYIAGYNVRNSGTTSGEDGYTTNIESTALISGERHAGINKGIGSQGFEQIRAGIGFVYNSEGFHKIISVDFDTQVQTTLFTNLTDSNNIDVLPLDPNNYVDDIKIINDTYLIWNDANAPVGFTNLNTLKTGGYGTVLAEDFSLIKPQCLLPPTGTYGSDSGTPANYLFGLLPQFTVRWINDDFNYSTWSTWSKRIVPYQQNTPVAGADVSQNNYIIVSVNIGSIRATTINVSARFGTDVFGIIKNVTRAYIIALPHSTVDVANEVYEAYNSGTNTYSFAYYNNEISIPVSPLETDLLVDNIPNSAGAIEVVNGDIIAIGDLNTGYPRPAVNCTVAAVGYNPNIDIPAGTYPDPLRKTGVFPGESGSGAGGHKRYMSISFGGTPHTGDTIIVILVNIQNATNTRAINYTVPAGLDGNLAGVVAAYTPEFPRSSYVNNGDGTYTINFTGDPYFTMQTYSIELFFSGATVANSIASVLDNAPYQLARSFRDDYGRLFPLDTTNNDKIFTPSYAQVNGQAIEISWTINDTTPPPDAVDMQWLITFPPVTKVLDTTAVKLNYKGTWDAASNSPTLAINAGTVGDTYQITTPASPAYTATYHDIANGATFSTGDYVTYNGQSWNVLPKDFGDLTPTGNIEAFSLNPLKLFNDEYVQVGVDTILGYDFAAGDRCTLHYYISNAITTFTIVPGTGYTDGTYTDVALTGGTGVNAKATVVVSGNVVTSVTLTNIGSGYSVSDSLTGTVPGGTGWSITVTAINAVKTFINNPCVNLSVFGYDAGTYIVKVEKSANFDMSVLAGTNTFLRLYSPAPKVTNVNNTVWFEIGERIGITNGAYDKLSGTITDGGVYYKTRQFPDALLPYTNPPINVLATDLNYSDFYASAFWSGGRPRAYLDVLEQTQRKAIIAWSESYVLGSRINGLNRFYPENVYGTKGGETSSNYGAIVKMLQVNNELVVIQALNHGSIPVYQTVYIDALQRTTVAVSEKLFNPIRYTTSKHIGIGTAKESVAIYNNVIYWIDPNRSQPVRWEGDGCFPISLKMTKYFKSTLQQAIGQGYKIIGWYDIFNDEYIISIEQPGGVISTFAFNTANWQTLANLVVAPGDITISTPPSHSTPSYNSMTGIVTLTPTTDYVGSDTMVISFPTGTGTAFKNACFAWTAGDTTVDPFVFLAQTGVELSTEIISNTITVTGPNVPVAISITGGDYSLDGGSTWVNTSGTVSAGQVVEVRVLSSGSHSTPESAVLTISGTSATFTATTKAVGNFTVSANYGFTIESVVDNTATGVPAGFASISVGRGQNLSLAYTALTAGSIDIVVSGTPDIPGHVRVTAYVAGVSTGSRDLPNSGSWGLTIGAATDPQIVLIAVESF